MEKETQFSSYIWKFRSHVWRLYGLLIYWEAFPLIWLCNRSHLNFLIYAGNFVFDFYQWNMLTLSYIICISFWLLHALLCQIHHVEYKLSTGHVLDCPFNNNILRHMINEFVQSFARGHLKSTLSQYWLYRYVWKQTLGTVLYICDLCNEFVLK